MSADQPGSTTYTAGFGPRSSSLRKPDPYQTFTPSAPPSPRNASRMGSTNGVPPPINPDRLAYSLSEQYKLKKYRDEFADRINEDAYAFKQEEESKTRSARKRRDEYRGALEEQIRMRSASREAERKRLVEQKNAIQKDFEAHLSETLRFKEHQRLKHSEYNRQVQEQQSEMSTINSRKKADEEAIAMMINQDALAKKVEDEAKRSQKKQLQKELAQDMMRTTEERMQAKEELRRRRIEEDKAYLAFVDAKAAAEEHERENHIRSRQKILPTVTLPKIDAKPDTMPNYLEMLEKERLQHLVARAEQQKATRELLNKQMEERSARKREEKERDQRLRLALERDAKVFEEEQISARRQQRNAAIENEKAVATQITQSIRRQYRIDEDEWKNLSTNSKK